tara:strand:+ start:1057 stop:2112 length:1056 start_codon:yes stop_codon:yes gene_type:complete
MMNRILKRPMFRMGGRSDDGIMSVRPKYQEGGDVGFFTKIKDAIFPPSGVVLERIQNRQKEYDESKSLFNQYKDYLANKPVEFRTQAEADKFLEANPEFVKPIKILSNDKIINLESTNDTGEPSNVPGTPIVPDPQKKVERTGGKTEEQSDKDLIKSYMDMFSEAMGESEEDISRQRYLELAKFGANLLAQPGGDLVGAIGKAAAPAIEGLSRSAADRSAANREIKLAGLKTAIAQMDNPTQEKIETLARISGLEPADVAKVMIDTGTDSSAANLETTAKALEGEVGAKTALVIAQTLDDAGLKLNQVDPIPVDKKGKPKEGVPDGFYYDEKGKVYKVEKGKPSQIKITKD